MGIIDPAVMVADMPEFARPAEDRGRDLHSSLGIDRLRHLAGRMQGDRPFLCGSLWRSQDR